jgi:hypothetical protein
VNKYVAGYYATEIQKALKTAPNYTAMDMMLYEAATKDGVSGTGVTYALASAPGTYRASSEVSAPFAVGTWVEFEVHSSHHNGTGNDMSRVVYSPRWFDSIYRNGTALTTSAKARGVVRGTWSSSAGKGGYSVETSDGSVINGMIGKLGESGVVLDVPYAGVLGAASGPGDTVLVGSAPTASEPLPYIGPLLTQRNALIRRRFWADKNSREIYWNDYSNQLLEIRNCLHGKIVAYRGAYCVAIGALNEIARRFVATEAVRYTVDLLTLLPANAAQTEVSVMYRNVRCDEIVQVPVTTSNAYTAQIMDVGARLATTGERVTAIRATFRGLPAGSSALYDTLASAGAAERAKTCTATMPVPFYGQIDSMLAAIPTESARIECEVTYPNTELSLAAPETVAEGGVVIYRGRTWVVTDRPTDLASLYNLREAIASHIIPLAPPETAHYVDPSDLVPTQWTAAIVEDTATLPRWDGRSTANYVVWQPPGEDAACEVGYITDKRYTYAVAGALQQAEYSACYDLATKEVLKPRPNYAPLNSWLQRLVWSAGPAVAGVYMGYTIQNRESRSVLEKETTVVKRDRATTLGVARDRIWTSPLLAEIGSTVKASYRTGKIVQIRYPLIYDLSSRYRFRTKRYYNCLFGRFQQAPSYASMGSERQLVYLIEMADGLCVALAPSGSGAYAQGLIQLA